MERIGPVARANGSGEYDRKRGVELVSDAGIVRDGVSPICIREISPISYILLLSSNISHLHSVNGLDCYSQEP